MRCSPGCWSVSSPGSCCSRRACCPSRAPVGVAASTLAALALFNPLRGRIQRVVDRRFNRARYDAETTVAAFAARLRNAVDVDTVLDELAATAGASLEPAHVSVWIKP